MLITQTDDGNAIAERRLRALIGGTGLTAMLLLTLVVSLLAGRI